MHSRLNNLRIAGLAVTTGADVRDFIQEGLAAGLDRSSLERTAKAIGLRERRVASAGITALDLCVDASTRLLVELGIDATSIDAVIFVTQTPDYPQPNNASLLHHRFGVNKSALTFDLCMGCSGWVVGLHQAASLCANGAAARVLLCAGDTLSRLPNSGDRSLSPLFGDAGSATIVEKTGRSAPMHFVFGSDGAGAEAIIVRQGGARQPDGPLREKTDADGNRSHDANLVMNGADVFSFSMREVPPAVDAVMQHAGFTPHSINALVLHQANRFIVSSLARKIGIAESKTPSESFGRYGNLSSASIPCALIDEMSDRLESESMKIVGCGYGVGLSWGAFAGELGPMVIAPILPFPR